MDTSNGQPDPLAGTGITYEESKSPAQAEPKTTPEPTASKIQSGSDPLAGTDVEYTKPLSATYRQVMDSPASKNAQVLKLSAQTGMTPAQVAQDPESVQKASSSPRPDYLDGLQAHSPETAKWLNQLRSDGVPNIASVHDDIPAHVQHESAYKDFYKSSQEAMASFLKYAVLGTPFEQGGIGPLSWHKADIEDMVDRLQTRADSVSSPDLNAQAIDEAKKGNYKPLEAQLVASIPNLAKMVGTFAANPVLGGYGIMAETSGKAYEQSIQAGLPPTTASGSALIKGTVATGATFLTFGLLGKLYGPLTKEIGVAGAREAIRNAVVAKLATDAAFVGQGQAQMLANAVTDKLTGENPKAFDDYGKKAVDEGILDLVQGQMMTLPGLGMTVLAKGPVGAKAGGEGKPGEALQSFHEETAQAGKDFFTKALDTAKARKLSTDNPFQAKEIDDALGKQYGGQEVHIPIEQFQEMYQEKAEDMAGKMGEDFKKSYEQAQSTGGTVHGPLSDILTNKADIKPQELADHVKFSPEGKTVFEAQESKKEMVEAQAKEEKQKTEDEKALQDFEKMVKEGAESVGGEIAKGSGTQAKGIARVLQNMSKVLGKSVPEILQMAKFSIQKERTAKQSFDKAYDESHGFNSPADFIKRYGYKLLVDKADETKVGGELESEQKRVQGQLADAKEAGLQATTDATDKKALSPSALAQHLFDLADTEINRSSLPHEWWDEGGTGRPDATHDDILEIIRNGGSGVEQMQKMNEAMQGHNQPDLDKFSMKPEDEKDIFGNVLKKSKVDEVFNDKTLKPNLDAKQQDMFGAKETKPNGAQQEMFQSSNAWDQLNRGGDWGRFRAKEQEIMGMKPAVIDYKTGQIWTGNEHTDALRAAQDDGNKRVGYESTGFLTKDGRFIPREEAEKNFGFKTSDGLKDSQEFFQSGDAQREFLQGHRGRIIISGVAGEPQGRDFWVYANAGGDKSTLFHEFAHAFLQIFRDHVAAEDATPEAREIEKKLLEWFDVKKWDDVTDRHSEMFARGFEYRLWEGKTPSSLEKVFAKFADWMRKIYPSSQVMGAYLKSVGAEMTDEMRSVYDRFIASSEEISQAEKTMGYSKEAPPGLTETELADWKSRQDKATQEAMKRLNVQKMKGLAKESEHNLTEERHDAEERASKDVDELPIFQAKDAFEGLDKEFEGNAKDIATRYLKGDPTEKERVGIEYVALQHGYNNGAELAYGLAHSDRAKEIKDRVDAHMERVTPKIKGNPEDIQMAVLGGEERGHAIAQESAIFKRMMDSIQDAKEKMSGFGKMSEPSGKKAVTSIVETPQQKVMDQFKAQLEKSFAKIKIEPTPEEKVKGVFKKELEKEIDKAIKEHEATEETVQKLRELLTKVPELPDVDTKALNGMLDQVEQIRKETAEKDKIQRLRDYANAKVQASDIMDSLTFNKARNIRGFISDMTNAAKKADRFSKEEDYAKAREWKLKQLLNRELALQAAQNRTFIAKSIKGLQKMGKIEKKPLAMPFGHWFQIKDILEGFGMKEPKPLQDYTFKKIATEMQSQGKTNDQIADATGYTFDEDGKPSRESLTQFKTRIMESNPQLGGRINLPGQMKLKDMTIGDLRDIKNSVEAIYKHGRDAHELKLVGKEEAKEKYVGRAIDRLRERFGRKEGDKTIMPHDEGLSFEHPASAAVNAILNGDDYLMTYTAQLPRVIRNLDGGDKGPFNDMLDKIIGGGIQKIHLEHERTEGIENLKRKYYSTKEWDDFMDKHIHTKTSQGHAWMTKAMIRGVYELSGTKEGLNYLKTGLKYSDEDLLNLRNLLDKKDIDFIHEHSEKMVSSKWPKVVATEMELNGVEPKPVELLPVETRHGIRTGVYRPIEADPKRSFQASSIDEILQGEKQDTQNSAAWHPFRASTEKGFIKERQKVIGVAPNLSSLVWDRYHERTENYLSYQPVLKEINKILTDKNFTDELRRAIGPGAQLFEKQLMYLVSGQSVHEGFIGKTFANMRRMVVGASIGLRGTLFVRKLATDGMNAYIDEKDGKNKWLAMQAQYGLNVQMSFPKQDGTVGNATLYGNAKMRDLIEKVSAIAPDMKEQSTNYDFNAKEFAKLNVENNFVGKILATSNLPRVDRLLTQNVVARWFKLNMYMAERSADASIRFPKWWDIYQKELANGTSPELAKIQASKVTKLLLGSAEPLYHTGPQRGSEIEKQLTAVISFATNQFGSFVEKGYRPLKSAIFQKQQAGNIFKAAAICAAAGSQYFIAPALMKVGIKSLQGEEKNPKEAAKDTAMETANETFQGVPMAGYIWHGLSSGRKGAEAWELPFMQSLVENGQAIKSLGLSHIGHMTEKDWDNELKAFSDDTSFPKSMDTIVMNFMNYLDTKNEWDWRRDLSVKRKLQGSKSPWLAH